MPGEMKSKAMRLKSLFISYVKIGSQMIKTIRGLGYRMHKPEASI